MKANDSTQRQQHGQEAEAIAARYLAARGLMVLARNFRCRGGEIDLVCRDARVIVFVEVRLRHSQAYGGAAASIDGRKQARIILAARHWLARHGANDADCRFDCVLLDRLDEAHVDWVRHAFTAD
ncbi:YraN family protein [Rhodocyclus tenuis]|uniref:UPF0102 protein GHK24_13150 n=2 Tax=Rhodocyclus TaxID=1064 RepID=A0A6L5K035_RHOTE|nr:YraN family protein [Rhodocyclus gracilis]MRD74100.1 YraN family protein [Rhodocyclus gracilis]NJA90196.1 YraN family protein [Rhodocyclus gracilis]